MALESVFINDMPRLWTDLDPLAHRQENNKKEKKSITACVRCRNISLALSRSAWLLRWKWLLRHQHKHQYGQRQRLREAAASEPAARAAAEAVAAAAATAINKTHTFCEADAHTHSHSLGWLLPFFARARLAAQWSKAFIYATAMFPLSMLAFFCYLLPVSEN